MGCRICEGVVVANEDLNTGIICGEIFIHLQIFIRHCIDHWYSEACNACNILSDNKCSNIFPRSTPKGKKPIMFCFIGPSLIINLYLMSPYSSLSWAHIVGQYNVPGVFFR